MYLSDLCSTKNVVFTGFVRFPQLYPPETKTPWDANVIAPDTGDIVIVKICTQAHAWVRQFMVRHSNYNCLFHIPRNYRIFSLICFLFSYMRTSAC